MSQKNIHDKLAELETIVSHFNDENIAIDTALKQFEIGATLADEIEKDLSDLKVKITVLKEKFDTAA